MGRRPTLQSSRSRLRSVLAQVRMISSPVRRPPPLPARKPRRRLGRCPTGCLHLPLPRRLRGHGRAKGAAQKQRADRYILSPAPALRRRTKTTVMPPPAITVASNSPALTAFCRAPSKELSGGCGIVQRLVCRPSDKTRRQKISRNDDPALLLGRHGADKSRGLTDLPDWRRRRRVQVGRGERRAWPLARRFPPLHLARFPGGINTHGRRRFMSGRNCHVGQRVCPHRRQNPEYHQPSPKPPESLKSHDLAS